MTTIYVDQAVVLDAARGESRGAPAFNETAVRSLGHLGEAGHDVVLVVDPSSAPADAPHPVDWSSIPVEALPIRPAEQSWYLTNDADRCQGRSALLRTVMVGSAPAPAAIHRCDALARDVPAAVLEILAAEAMRS